MPYMTTDFIRAWLAYRGPTQINGCLVCGKKQYHGYSFCQKHFNRWMSEAKSDTVLVEWAIKQRVVVLIKLLSRRV